MKRLLKIVAALLLVVVLLAIGGGWMIARSARQKMEEAQAQITADWKRFEPRIVAAEARWKADPLTAPHPGGDAAALLFAHVRWEKDGKPPAVPPALAEAIRVAGVDWPRGAGVLDLAAIDSSWMSQLGTFSHWDIEGRGTPLQDEPFALLSEPVPLFTDLQALAKVRLLQGLEAGAAAEAGRDVRELARLCLTTETLIGVMVGTALLANERRAHEEAVRRGQDVTGWTPVSEADQLSLRNLLWTSGSSHSVLSPEPVAGRRFAVGECTSLREGLGMALFLRGFLQDELSERYAALGQALDASPCRLRRLRLAWKSTTPSAGVMPTKGSALCMQEPGVDATSCAVPDWIVWLPFARGYIGRSMATISTMDWFAKYREEDK